MVPFMEVDPECLALLAHNHLEDSLVELLRNHKSNDQIMS